ncbi:hypothetical protein, partial [Sphingopyxis sp. LK2115]|uniref:hypothetical protein n=1 Tax=Sphingopyxis sp. LK2115 TaxID=2744558 RepID=UPI001CB7256E
MSASICSHYAVGTAAFVLALVTGVALAQERLPEAAVPDNTTAAGSTLVSPGSPRSDGSAIPVEVTAGTLIYLRLDETVNSKTHKTGDWFAISLLHPIMLGDLTLVPAGTPGRGQVVHSAKSSWGGKAGELILGARYLEHDGERILLRGMKLGGVGGNNEGLAFGASVAGGVAAMPLIFALNGKNAHFPAGIYATAKLAVALPGDSSAVASATADPVVDKPATSGEAA